MVDSPTEIKDKPKEASEKAPQVEAPKVEFSQGKFERTKVNGSEQLPKMMLVNDQQPEQPEDKRTEAEKAIDDGMRELESKYNIHFETPSDSPYADRVRKPTQDELAAMKSALEKSPTAIKESGYFSSEKPLLITFLKDNQNEPPAQHQMGAPRIIMFGKTDKNFETTFLHELAHNEDRTISGVDKTKLGWQQALDPNTGNKTDLWLFEGKDGTLYRMNEGKSITWTKVDEYGREIDADKPGSTISNEEMYKQAKITPASHYFYTKEDMVAEAVEMYRGDEKSNLELYRKSPELYRAIRQWDQQQLDKKYGGPWPWSSPYMYRDVDGKVKPVPSDGNKRTAESVKEQSPVAEGAAAGMVAGAAEAMGGQLPAMGGAVGDTAR